MYIYKTATENVGIMFHFRNGILLKFFSSKKPSDTN